MILLNRWRACVHLVLLLILSSLQQFFGILLCKSQYYGLGHLFFVG